MATLKGRTLFITGASRGIGLAIALRAARDGANIVIAAKTTEPHPKLPGTIYTAAEEIEKAGGKALACVVDVRDEDQIAAAVAKTVETFGGIDILINNASAISLTGTASTPMKRYDLMHSINTRGTFVCSQACIPHLKKSPNPHILKNSPPLNMEARWFAPHVAYTMAKFGMTMCVLGMAEELRGDGIAVNAIWPRTVIATAAVQNLLGGDSTIAGQPHARDHGRRGLRHPDQAEPRVHRQLLHRRGAAARRRASPTSASTRRCPAPTSSRTSSYAATVSGSCVRARRGWSGASTSTSWTAPAPSPAAGRGARRGAVRVARSGDARLAERRQVVRAAGRHRRGHARHRRRPRRRRRRIRRSPSVTS